jgi:hypothetical protein
MRSPIAIVAVTLACSPADQPVDQPATPIPTVSASAQARTENARDDYAAAEALVVAGKYADARAAFEEVIRKFAYSRLAKEAELRIAQVDDKLGRPEAISEYRTWAKNHPSDERASGIAVKASTVGDTTCRVDADCTTTTQRVCCECCPSGPYATSRQWLAWQRTHCTTSPCNPCDKKCAPVDQSAVARCNAGQCELAP